MNTIKRFHVPAQLLPRTAGASNTPITTVDGPLEPQDQLVQTYANYAGGKPVSIGAVYKGYSLIQDCRPGPATLYVVDADKSIVSQFKGVQLTMNELNNSVAIRSLSSALQQTIYPWLTTTASNYNGAGSTMAAHWYPNQPDSIHAFAGGHQVSATLSGHDVHLGDGSVIPMFVAPSLLHPV